MRSFSFSKAFTLIELLVVIAIIAILAVVVVLTLNPAQLLAQSRDANRVSDLATLNSAIGLYQTDVAGGSLGNSSTSYSSIPSATSNCSALGMATSAYQYHCASSSDYRKTNDTGWLPIDFASISSGAPFGSLPVDPINQTSSNLYYTYETNGSQYAISAFMESTKYAPIMRHSGGVDPALYEVGSGIASLPDTGRGLAGYWPLNEGSGAKAYDVSGNGDTGTWNGTPAGTSGYYSPGILWKWAGAFNGSTNSVTTTVPTVNTAPNGANTVSFWMYPTSLGKVVFSLGAFDYFLNTASCSGINNDGAVYGAAAPPLNTWTYVTLVLRNGTYGSNGSAIYYNGNPVTPTCSSGSATASSSPSLLIGIYYQGGFDFAGKLSDFRVYNRALSSAEIKMIYNAED